MKASRFIEELPPAEPELFERWQLDDPGAGAPALEAAPAPAELLPRDPRVVPALFGPAPANDRAEADGDAGDGDGGGGPGGADVPF
jgi:DNA helicase-2/ATP-dependent DNA helicase PcrA